jgi:hypothetical protein
MQDQLVVEGDDVRPPAATDRGHDADPQQAPAERDAPSVPRAATRGKRGGIGFEAGKVPSNPRLALTQELGCLAFPVLAASTVCGDRHDDTAHRMDHDADIARARGVTKGVREWPAGQMDDGRDGVGRHVPMVARMTASTRIARGH